ncbi:MAG: hypothetical protein LUE27_00405 [Clostridia bacterium]|nr:hypothetical protein [Clostridia bacterium]
MKDNGLTWLERLILASLAEFEDGRAWLEHLEAEVEDNLRGRELPPDFWEDDYQDSLGSLCEKGLVYPRGTAEGDDCLFILTDKGRIAL